MEFTVDFMKVYEDAKQIFASPQAFFSRTKKTDWKNAAVFFAIVSFVGNIGILVYIFTFYPQLANQWPEIFNQQLADVTVLEYLPTAFFSYFIGFVLSFVWGGILMAWLMLFKTKRDFNNSYKAIVYSRTPSYLLSWVPLVNLLAEIYSLYLLYVALREYFSFDSRKSAVVVILGVAITTLVVASAAIYIQ